MSMVHPSIEDVADRPVSGAITIRGKELAAAATVGEARALFESSSVQLVPVLDGGVYVGAVSRDDIADAPDAEPITEYATSRPPIATASTSVGAAIDSLIQDGGRRLGRAWRRQFHLHWSGVSHPGSRAPVRRCRVPRRLTRCGHTRAEWLIGFDRSSHPAD